MPDTFPDPQRYTIFGVVRAVHLAPFACERAAALAREEPGAAVVAEIEHTPRPDGDPLTFRGEDLSGRALSVLARRGAAEFFLRCAADIGDSVRFEFSPLPPVDTPNGGEGGAARPILGRGWAPAVVRKAPPDPEEPLAPRAGPPAEFGRPPAEFEVSPAEFEVSPAEFEAPPAEFEAPPAEFERPPAEFECPPAEVERPPAEFGGPQAAALPPALSSLQMELWGARERLELAGARLSHWEPGLDLSHERLQQAEEALSGVWADIAGVRRRLADEQKWQARERARLAAAMRLQEKKLKRAGERRLILAGVLRGLEGELLRGIRGLAAEFEGPPAECQTPPAEFGGPPAECQTPPAEFGGPPAAAPPPPGAAPSPVLPQKPDCSDRSAWRRLRPLQIKLWGARERLELAGARLSLWEPGLDLGHKRLQEEAAALSGVLADLAGVRRRLADEVKSQAAEWGRLAGVMARLEEKRKRAEERRLILAKALKGLEGGLLRGVRELRPLLAAAGRQAKFLGWNQSAPGKLGR